MLRMYAPKIHRFLDQLFEVHNVGTPLMRQYLQSYFDLYWDLHLGVAGRRDPGRSSADRPELHGRPGLLVPDVAGRA